MTQTINKEIELYPVQDDFFNCEDNFTAFIGGIGSGKSFVGAVKAITRALPGTLGMICAPTYKMLRDSSLRTYQELAGPGIIGYNKTDGIITMTGGGEVLLRSADDPDSLRGPNLSWAWIEEGGLTHPKTHNIVIGRLRQGGGFGEVWTTSTPKGKNNWLYKQSKHMTVFRASTLDNPYTSELWKKSLLGTYTGKFLRQEVYAEFVSFEGLIYDFDRNVHVKKRNPSEFLGFGIGVDEGYTNPAVLLKIYYDHDGRFHIMEEYYKRGQLQEDIVKEAKAMSGSRDKELVVDSSAAGLIAAFKDAGLKARPHTGRVIDGINQVATSLKVREDGTPGLTVDPSCVNTINEFESYSWKDGKDAPIKEMDHAMDGLRYYIDKPTGAKISTGAKVSSYIGRQGKQDDDRPPF